MIGREELEVERAARRRLAADPELGAGNALRRVLEVSARPDAPFVVAERPLPGLHGPAAELSLAEVDALAQAWSCWHLDHGIGRRDRVAVYLDESFEYLLHFFALTQIGAIPVLINGRMAADTAAAHAARTGAAGVVTDRAHAGPVREHLAASGRRPWVDVGAEVRLEPRPLPERSRHRHAAEDPILICHSSGTTGVPKPVIWTHGQAVAGFRHQVARAARHEETLLLALPQSHAAAVAFTTLSLLAGHRLALPAGFDGASVVRAIARLRPTMAVAFAGTFAEVATLDANADDLASMQTWISIGDAAHQAHVGRLVRCGRHRSGERSLPGSIFVDGFGSSELGWGIFSHATVAGRASADRCLGTPQAFARAAVLRDDGSEARPGEVGMLAVQGPTVSPGYWGDSDLTYRSKLRGYWLSGDLVYRDEHDRFYHVDRTTDAIPVAGGVAYSLLMEELLLARLPELLDCTVVAGQGGPAGIARTGRPDADPEALLRRANDVLRKGGHPPLATLQIARSDGDIPIGVTRKVLKRQLREQQGGNAHA